ncbi:hypothetical protein QR680_001410 [Steinernema hermaphroditum]|uniref:Matrix-remodeling-associated protein 7 helical domain-containing protein n=1 Tax=Steinernema hermaphroditum TaxID=289476 RepID=A0AA39GY74_9BILA|nr:hypothetical protein QR680_001410 [Steinernema hermaphroditum]
MTIAGFGVNLLSTFRYPDGVYYVFSALLGLAVLFVMRKKFFRTAHEDSEDDEDLQCSDNAAEEISDENEDEAVQESFPKKVVERKNVDGEGTSELIMDMESDYETTIDILQTLGKLHGKLATAELRAKTKKLEQAMTKEQLKEESDIKKQQLESIYSLMKAQGDKFGLNNKGDLEEQMKLYAI